MFPPRFIFLAFCLLLCSRFASGETVINSTFVGKAPAPNFNHYSNASSWSPAEVPNNTQTKQFNVNTGNPFLQVVVDIDATISTLTVAGPDGSISVLGKTFTVTGTTSLQDGYIEIRPNGTPGKFNAGTLLRFSDYVLSGSYIIGSYNGSGAATLQFTGADIRTFTGQQLVLYGELSAIVDESGKDALRNLARLEKTSSLYLNDHSVLTNAPFFNDGFLSISQTNVPATFTAAISLANFDPATRTITGGIFNLYSTSFPAGPALLRFNGADIVNLGSIINLYGPAARIADLAGNDGLRNFARILPSGLLGLDTHDLTISGPFQNDGTVRLMTSTFTANGAFTNFDATTRTLTGGSVVLNQGSQLKFAAADVVHNASAITLTFSSAITDLAGNDALRNFNDNLSAGNFVLGFRGQFTAPGDFTNAGRVETVAPVRSRFPSPSPTPSPEGRFFVPPGARYVQTAGMTLNNGQLTADHVDILGGTLSGAGVVKGNVFVQDGVLNFGGQIDGNLTLTAGSHFGAGDLKGLVTVNGQATVAGTLEVDIAYEHFVSSDSVFTVLTSALPLKGAFGNAPPGARIATTDGKGSVVVTYDGHAVYVGQYQAEPPPTQLVNISSRAFMWAAKDDPSGVRAVIIGGFIVSGNAQKEIVLRALGPSLAQFGLSPVLLDPILELHGADGSLIASNDNWVENRAAITATGLAPTDDREAALRTTVTPGPYTVVVKEKNGAAGNGLVEVYDFSQNTTSKLANISTRGYADGTNVLIGGIVAGGPGSGNADLVVRALGQELKHYGVSNALDDPTLEVRDHNGVVVGFNDDWSGVYPDPVAVSGLEPSDKAESAIYLSLPRGDYTAIVRAKGNSAGVATVEFYDLRR